MFVITCWRSYAARPGLQFLDYQGKAVPW